MKQREDAIKDSLEQAEKAKDEAKQILAQNQNSLAKAEEESKRLLSKAEFLLKILKSNCLKKAKSKLKTC